MNAIAAEIFDGDFFAPVQYAPIESLIESYTATRRQLIELANQLRNKTVLSYFLEGNRDGRSSYGGSVEQLFNIDGAVAALNADYWNKALTMTGLLATMPNARREQWNEQIRERTTPDFTAEYVVPTLQELIDNRGTYFAEFVDGIFRALSGTHCTNRPEAFQKRAIISHVFDDWGLLNYGRAGYVHDLRRVIARFMGWDEPSRCTTESLLKMARARRGQWIEADGGALRVRGYQVGTVHLEVHPDMAYRLNSVLASLYPNAIPARFRTRPAQTSKTYTVMQQPLPAAVVALVSRLRGTGTVRSFGYGYGDSSDKHVRAMARRVLEGIGGVLTNERTDEFTFGYDPADVLAEIVTFGSVPEHRSHQFYPTPAALAQRLVDAAEIQDGQSVLEPSAGIGNLAQLVPSTDVTTVELSPLHCQVLRAKGFDPIEGDFIAWAAKTHQRFDSAVLNPPFDQGRALLHVQTAAKLLKPGGRIAAILPAGMRGKDILNGWPIQWSEEIHNAFSGTSISVVIMTANAPL